MSSLRGVASLALAVGLLTHPFARAQDAPVIEPFSKAALGDPPKGWMFVTIPNKPDKTTYTIVDNSGLRALQVRSDHSYGNLVYDWHLQPMAGQMLEWSWRVDKLVENADLTARSGDDSPAKLCLSFGLPSSKLSVAERTKLALARTALGTDLPTETLCYVWDNKLAPGTELPNAFTQRIRTVVLQSGPGSLGKWRTERRDVVADYLKAFGNESGGTVPPIIELIVAADSDNTGGSSTAYFGDIRLLPK